jgi:hypothetical protein
MTRMIKNGPELRASLKELAELGSPVDISVAEFENANQAHIATLEIEQVGRDSQICQQGDGEACYMAYMRITNQTKEAIYPVEVELRSFWGESITDLLPPSQIPIHRRWKPDSSYPGHRFPQGRELSHEDQVLNGLLLNRERLVPKRPLEGWLLALGNPLPADVKHGQIHELVLTITGSDQTKYSQAISFWVDRAAPRAKATKATASGGLDRPAEIRDLFQSEPPLVDGDAPRRGSLYK